jgi:hypothetical protein
MKPRSAGEFKRSAFHMTAQRRFICCSTMLGLLLLGRRLDFPSKLANQTA